MATNKKIETSKIQKILKYIGVLMFLITSQESHECFSFRNSQYQFKSSRNSALFIDDLKAI